MADTVVTCHVKTVPQEKQTFGIIKTYVELNCGTKDMRNQTMVPFPIYIRFIMHMGRDNIKKTLNMFEFTPIK